jgi:hypothetical protein
MGRQQTKNHKAETEEKVMPTAPCCVLVRFKDRHCIKRHTENQHENVNETDMKV